MKKSFTMIELIFVIVVLAIIAGGTFEFILRVYQTYSRAKTVDLLQTEIDLALTQIANRLSYRIKDSVIYGGSEQYLHDDVQEDILEWISYDNEGLMGMWNGSAVVPAWSGFIDRTLATDNTIKSLGSNLNFANQIVQSLSNNRVSLTNDRVALIIPNSDGFIRYGWYGSDEGNNSFIVHCSDGSCADGEDDFTYSSTDPEYDETKFLDVVNNTETGGTDRYYLAWSAYSLVRNTANNELRLYYNYQPWAGDDYNDGSNSLLLENVNLFQFWQGGNVIWIRICMDSNNSDTLSLESSSTYGFCKERAIY